MDNMDRMDRRLAEYALPFVAWELRLFLDTHPDDSRALAEYRSLCAKAGCSSYACLPDCACGKDRWNWIDDPWPWEASANLPAGGGCRGTRPMMCQRRA